MKISLAKSAGFCFGVKRAINISLHTAATRKNVYMLSDIVHNEEVVRQIHEAGIKKIKRFGNGKEKVLLLSAHGAANKTIEKAKQLGYEIIDATCPMVKDIHKIAINTETTCRKVVIIGDKKHNEVQGIIGQLKNKAIVIDSIDNIPYGSIKKIKKASVVVQSTQNIDKALKIVKVLKKYIPELKFFNTICRPTRIKQEEIKTMPRENDVMIIIGSKNSANTKRLYEISKPLNNRSYWVNTKEGIKPEWLKGANKIGVTAGASTPESTIKRVIQYLSCL